MDRHDKKLACVGIGVVFIGYLLSLAFNTPVNSIITFFFGLIGGAVIGVAIFDLVYNRLNR